jgi:predicted transcriptional regulator
MVRTMRRNLNAITAQILEICADGANKTRVIYQANLDSTIGTQYLNNLAKNGLIQAIPDGSRFIYKTTPKGLELQEKLGQYQSMVDQLYTHA